VEPTDPKKVPNSALIQKLNQDELAQYEIIKKYLRHFKRPKRKAIDGDTTLTERALQLKDDGGRDSKSQESRRNAQENFISKNIRTVAKIDKIQKVKMICRAIIKEQEIQSAQTIRSQQQAINAEVAQMRNNRWEDFKERRLVACKNYITVIKKVKLVKTFIIHCKLLQILKVFMMACVARKQEKKLMLAQMFISIKLLLGLSKKSRRYAHPDMGTFHALMVKFKNTIRYSFVLGALTYRNGFAAVKLEADQSRIKLVNYGINIRKAKEMSALEFVTSSRGEAKEIEDEAHRSPMCPHEAVYQCLYRLWRGQQIDVMAEKMSSFAEKAFLIQDKFGGQSRKKKVRVEVFK